ncbi:hypothetical protein [Hymenobacter cellulosilyticus]|uniref:Uncharacterized protein n=1 Tax=Hymenobacter cellulosilyticus TaxID=2932248 RepID=A0A8T9Q448_9BACT|nr:hypothetical protein [Hymenobacter cellulosilyticus]UOQ72354.1 hypothetical protein MUN79_28085 [Hymenobacter cellulosilyticus]
MRPRLKGAQSTVGVFNARPDDPFYQDVLDSADNTLQRRDAYTEVRRYANYILLALGVVALVGWWRSGRRE